MAATTCSSAARLWPLWWASVPGEGAGTSAARALQRFLTTPDATSALLARPARPDRARPRVPVELWS